MTRQRIPALIALWLTLLLPAAVVASEPTPAPSPAAPEAATGDGDDLSAWLRGPFGTVLGGSPDDPATAPPDSRPLDTWMRGAWLELAVPFPLDELVSATVVTRPLAGGGGEAVLSRGAPQFAGPEEVGQHIITATLESDEHGLSEHAWLVLVPDRQNNPEALWEMPAVDASLQAAAGSVEGVRGHGCYVQGCQEVGYRPPARSLEALTVAVGETPRLLLGDGSALRDWQGTLEAQPDTISEDVRAGATFEDGPQAAPLLTGLEPPAAGEWLLELRVDFDRSRGWQWYLFRLAAE